MPTMDPQVWPGAGGTWPRVTGQTTFRTAAETPRFWPREDSMSSSVMRASANNSANFSSDNAAIQSLAENTARGENFKIKT